MCSNSAEMVKQYPRVIVAILLVILEPSVVSMKQSLDIGSGAYIEKMCSSRCGNDDDMQYNNFPVVQTQFLPQAHFSRMRQIMFGADNNWRFLPRDGQTEYYSCLIFRLWTRSGGAAFYIFRRSTSDLSRGC